MTYIKTQIKPPCCITPSLLPGILVADVWVSVGCTGRRDSAGRPEWEWRLDGAVTDTGNELWCHGTHREALENLLTFLLAWADPDSGIHDPDDPRPAPFKQPTLDWARNNEEEIEMLCTELENHE